MNPAGARLLLRALLALLGGLACALAAHRLGWLAGPSLLLLAGLGAALSAAALGLPWWWWLIELLFPVALAAGLGLALPAWVPAALLGLCLLLFAGAVGSRVPPWSSGRVARRLLCAQLPPDRPLDVVDLGGGFGGTVLALWRSGRCARCSGIEWAPLPFLVGWLRLRRAGFPGRWRLGSFWSHPLGRHDLVYAFLSPAAMPDLWRKARAEMRAGSWLVSYRFGIPGVAPDVRWQVGRGADDALLLWIMPGATGGSAPAGHADPPRQ